MRIIFQNGEVAELNNVEKIMIYNDLEESLCSLALFDYYMKEETTNEQHPSSTEVCDGSVSEPDMASEGSQHAGQTGIRNIPEEARGEGSSQAIDEFNWVDRFRKH